MSDESHSEFMHLILGQPSIRLTAALPENLLPLAGITSPIPTLVILFIFQRVK